MVTPTDAISIELEVSASGYDDTDVWMTGSLVIAINRTRPYTEDEIILTDRFFSSLERDGYFQIFSCVCGMPDCAGRPQGIRVQHRQGIVEWTDLDREQNWQLERVSIDRDLARVRDDVHMYRRFFAGKGIRYVGVGCDW
jgi:hypothetical protein